MRVPPDQRLALAVDLTVPAWKEYSLLGRGLVVVLAASVVAATGSLTYILVTEQPVEAFTEFYILGPAGNASDYAALNLSQPGTVILGIANHESMSINYTIRIDLVGVQIARNVTSGFNETVEINRPPGRRTANERVCVSPPTRSRTASTPSGTASSNAAAA